MIRTKLFLAAIALIALSGCAAQNVHEVLGNLDKDCVRHYAGSAATGVPGNATITFTIDCKPSGLPPEPVK